MALPTKPPGWRNCYFVGGPWDGQLHELPPENVGRVWRVPIPTEPLTAWMGGPVEMAVAVRPLMETCDYVPLRWLAMAPADASWHALYGPGLSGFPQWLIDSLCRFDEWVYYSPDEYAVLNPWRGIW